MWMRGNFLDESRSRLEIQFNRLASNQENIQMQMNSFSEELAELQGITSQLDSWSNTVNRSIETFQKRFGIIKPLLSCFSSENKENFQSDSVPSAPPLIEAHSADSDSVLYHCILDLEAKIKILENRVVGVGVQLGGCVFQSFDDLLVWVKTKVPKGRFGLFVDGHLFLEFFTLSGHIETETGTAAFSNSQRRASPRTWKPNLQSPSRISFLWSFVRVDHQVSMIRIASGPSPMAISGTMVLQEFIIN